MVVNCSTRTKTWYDKMPRLLLFRRRLVQGTVVVSASGIANEKQDVSLFLHLYGLSSRGSAVKRLIFFFQQPRFDSRWHTYESFVASLK